MDIQVNDNGPYLVSGPKIVLKDAQGKTWNLAGKERVALCRCGHSQNKPFCDGSHAKQGFQSKCAAS